jgi:outer membrane protein assembly factor BamD (BamD/ComL family)
VADEASLVHAGVVARRSGQPGRALELFDLHARTYPQGVLAEERDGERALALADLGRITEARAAIDRFLQAHPASPLAARLFARARLLDPVNP